MDGSVPGNDDFLTRLEAIFRAELDDPALRISQSSTPDDVEGWDSLATIRIVAAVEREFDCQFDAADIENIHSVSDISRLIASYS